MHPRIPNKEAVRAGDLIFFGGIIARDEKDDFPKAYDVEGQTELIIRRIEAYLRGQGLSLRNLVSVTVFLTDIRHYDTMNRAYAVCMPEPLPPRKVIVGPLTVTGAVVEMTAVASAADGRVLEPLFNP
jgi:enamine deaminase RidA (YjgF/YER057c/UK114 family)